MILMDRLITIYDIPRTCIPKKIWKAEDMYDTVGNIAKRCEYSEGHIRKLLRKGSIKGIKLDTFWLTTEIDVKDYIDKL